MLPDVNTIVLVIACLGSAIFLVSGLRAGKTAGRRSQLLSVLAGLVGLAWVAMQLCSHFYAAPIRRFREFALVFFFVRHLCSGIAVAFFSRFLIKSKPLLAWSLVLLVLFNAFVIVRHLTWVTRFVFIGEGLFAGMSVASLFLVWFDLTESSPDHRRASPAQKV